MKKHKYNFVLIYNWYISNDAPTNLDILRTPFNWNSDKIKEYVKYNYGRYVQFEIITNNITVAKEN